jgi:hypothetical protein
MGLLRSLLTVPATAPAKGGWWVMGQVIAAAEAELYDEGRIMQDLRDLSARLEDGEISEDEHAAAEDVLLQQLVEARQFRAERKGF